MSTIEPYLGILASLLLVVSQVTYIIQVAIKKVTPSLFSWLGFALLIGASGISQVLESGWEWSVAGVLFSAFGCFLVCIVALIQRNFSLVKIDWLYLSLGVACIAIYLISSDALLTTIFGVVADLVLAIPMILKTIKNRSSENYLPWVFSGLSWVITIFLCVGKPIVFWLFPIYLILFSGLMLILTLSKKRINTSL